MVWTGSHRQLSAPEALIGASHKEDHVISLDVRYINDLCPRFQLPPLEVASGSNYVLPAHAIYVAPLSISISAPGRGAHRCQSRKLPDSGSGALP